MSRQLAMLVINCFLSQMRNRNAKRKDDLSAFVCLTASASYAALPIGNLKPVSAVQIVCVVKKNLRTINKICVFK
jgi:hypothetical protein